MIAVYGRCEVALLCGCGITSRFLPVGTGGFHRLLPDSICGGYRSLQLRHSNRICRHCCHRIGHHRNIAVTNRNETRYDILAHSRRRAERGQDARLRDVCRGIFLFYEDGRRGNGFSLLGPGDSFTDLFNAAPMQQKPQPGCKHEHGDQTQLTLALYDHPLQQNPGMVELRRRRMGRYAEHASDLLVRLAFQHRELENASVALGETVYYHLELFIRENIVDRRNVGNLVLILYDFEHIHIAEIFQA